MGSRKYDGAYGLLGDKRTDEEAGSHAGEAEEEGLESYLIGGFEGWEPGEGGGLLFEAALLNQVEERGYEGEEEGGVGGQQQSDVEEDPAGVEMGKGRGLLAGAEGGDQAEKEADGKDEDAEGDGLVAPVDQDEGQGEEEAEEGQGLVGVDWERVVGGVEHLGQRDEVEEDAQRWWRGWRCGASGGGRRARPAGPPGRQCRREEPRL